MGIGMILKIFGDCCVCFAILGAFPGVFAHSYSLLWPALLCGIGAGLGTFLKESGRVKLSYLCTLIPFFALRFPENAGEMLILLPVIGYTALVILRGQLRLEYYAYRQYFLRSLMLLGGLYLALCMLSFLESIADPDIRTIYAEETLRYGVVHLITGIILQRQLRLGMENQAQGSKGQLAVVLGSTGVVILGFVAAEPTLRQGATAIFNGIITAVGSVIMVLYEGGTSLINDLEVKVMYEQVAELRSDQGIPSMGPVFQQMIQQGTQEEPKSTSYWWVFLVLCILFAAMGLMLRSFRKRSDAVYTEETVTQSAAPEEKKKESRYSNRGKVRHYYREFLRMENKRGLRLQKNFTTEDILQRISADTNMEAASQLRQVYLQARYDEKGEITREQVDIAKAALKKSRGG